jgi:hypothetical protein
VGVTPAETTSLYVSVTWTMVRSANSFTSLSYTLTDTRRPPGGRDGGVGGPAPSSQDAYYDKGHSWSQA